MRAYNDKGLLKSLERSGYGGARTTNQAMELRAVVEGLKMLKSSTKVTVVSDSRYVVDAFNLHWLEKWRSRGTVGTRPNGKLWLELDQLARSHFITWRWIKGHSGGVHDLADIMAQDARVVGARNSYNGEVNDAGLQVPEEGLQEALRPTDR